MRRPTIADLADRAERGAVYRIFIRDLEVAWTAGGSETGLMVGIDVVSDRPPRLDADRYRYVVCYDTIVKATKALAADPAVDTLQSLADAIGAQCLRDARVRAAAVRIAPLHRDASGDAGIATIHRRADRAATPLRAVRRG